MYKSYINYYVLLLIINMYYNISSINLLLYLILYSSIFHNICIFIIYNIIQESYISYFKYNYYSIISHIYKLY